VLAHDRWFSSGTPASSTTKTGRHDIVEILLKVALSTINKVKSNHTLNSSGNILYVVYNRFVVVLLIVPDKYYFKKRFVCTKLDIYVVSPLTPCWPLRPQLCFYSWYLHSQICRCVVSSKLCSCGKLYVKKFISDLQQVNGFLWNNWNIVESI
jgi:hypothetical protein